MRKVTMGAGAFFTMLGLVLGYMALDAPRPWLAVCAGLALVVLGCQAMVSAARNRRSWLERIGPLP